MKRWMFFVGYRVAVFALVSFVKWDFVWLYECVTDITTKGYEYRITVIGVVLFNMTIENAIWNTYKNESIKKEKEIDV